MELKEHKENVCEYRPYECEFCGEFSSTYKEVRNHYVECQSVAISCSKCETNIPRKYQQDHLDSKCPLVEVDCEYRYAGCEAQVLRKDMAAHLKELNHQELLIKHLEGKIAILEFENAAFGVLVNSLMETEAQRDSAKLQCDSLFSLLKDTEADRDGARQQCSEQSYELSYAKHRCETVAESLRKTEAQRDTAKRHCDSLSRLLKDAEADRADAVILADKLESQKDNAKQQCDSLFSLLKDTEADRDGAKQQCSEQSYQLSYAQHRCETLAESLRKTEAQRDIAKRQCDSLTRLLKNNGADMRSNARDLCVGLSSTLNDFMRRYDLLSKSSNIPATERAKDTSA